MNARRGGLIIAVVLLGIILYFNREPVKLVSQDSFMLKKVTANGYELQSLLKLKNPNLLSSTILNIDEKFYVNGELVSIMHIEFNQGIPGRGKETEFPIMVRFDRESLTMDLLADTNTPAPPLVVKVEGTIEYKNFMTDGKIVVDTEDSIKIN